MTLPRTVADVLRGHTTLEVECIDRIYLNLYVPQLQCGGGVALFFRDHRGHQFASTALMDPMTKSFVERVEQFAKSQALDLVLFEKGQRKDDLAHKYLQNFPPREGMGLSQRTSKEFQDR